jgi:PP-loop superfamily ATP-utilizing enzyme
VRESLVGNIVGAKQGARVALALSSGRDVEAVSAIAVALAGEPTQATRLAARHRSSRVEWNRSRAKNTAAVPRLKNSVREPRIIGGHRD